MHQVEELPAEGLGHVHLRGAVQGCHPDQEFVLVFGEAGVRILVHPVSEFLAVRVLLLCGKHPGDGYRLPLGRLLIVRRDPAPIRFRRGNAGNLLRDNRLVRRDLCQLGRSTSTVVLASRSRENLVPELREVQVPEGYSALDALHAQQPAQAREVLPDRDFLTLDVRAEKEESSVF